MSRWCLTLAVTLALGGLHPRAAHAAPAGGDAAAAANAFEQAQRAELARDHRRAAELYELADGLVPSPEALRSAVRNYEIDQDASRAASLAWTLAERYDDSKSQALAKQILRDFSASLLAVDLSCSTPCTASTDGRAVAHVPALAHRLFLDPGRHDLMIVFGKDLSASSRVEGEAGNVVDLVVERPPDPEPEPPASTSDVQTGTDERRGLQRISPAWFVGGAVVTAGLAGALVWSSLDVVQKNKTYESEPTQPRLDDGQRAELRTNVLVGVTAAVGVATVLLGVFTDWRRWKSAKRSQATALRVSPSTNGRSFGLNAVGRF